MIFESVEEDTSFSEMRETNVCLICFNPFSTKDRPTTNLSKLYRIYCQYLYSDITKTTISNAKSKDTTNLPLCPKCYQSAFELAELTQHLEFYQKTVSEFVSIFSSQILHRRSLTETDVNSETRTTETEVPLVDLSEEPNNRSGQNTLHIPEETHEQVVQSKAHEAVSKDENLSPCVKLAKLRFESNGKKVIAVEKDSCNVEGQDPHKRGLQYQTIWIQQNGENSYTLLKKAVTSEKCLGEHLTSPLCGNSPINSDQVQPTSSSATLKETTTLDNQVDNSKTSSKISTERKLYKCNICNKKFRRSKYVRYHKRTHMGENSFQNVNKGNRTAKCLKCGRKFSSKQNLQVHSKIHISGKSFNCSICNQAFKYISFLESHNRSQHPGLSEIQNTLNENDKPSTSANHPRYNQRREKVFQCLDCDSKFTTRPSMIRHHRSIHAKETYNCHICDKKFSQKYYMKMHIKSHHSTSDEQYYKCGESPFSAYSPDDLKNHKLDKQSKQISFKCRECELHFSNLGNLKIHYKSAHFALDFNSKCWSVIPNSEILKTKSSLAKQIEDNEPVILFEGPATAGMESDTDVNPEDIVETEMADNDDEDPMGWSVIINTNDVDEEFLRELENEAPPTPNNNLTNETQFETTNYINGPYENGFSGEEIISDESDNRVPYGSVGGNTNVWIKQELRDCTYNKESLPYQE